MKQKRQCNKSNFGYRLIHYKGEYIKTPDDLKPHHDADVTITYLKCCTGSIKIEGKHYKLSQGDIVLLNPDELHCFLIDDNPYHERITVSVNNAILKNFTEDADFEMIYSRKSGVNNIIPSDLVKKKHLDEMFDSLDISNNDLINEILNVCKIIELLSIIKEISISDISTNPFNSANKTINAVLSYLNANFLNHITIDSVAEHFYISKYHLCRLFKESVGMTLWNYVIMRRLLYFNELIKQNYSIETACYNSGFNNYSNFFRLYKKYMNRTPMELKKQEK